MRNILTSTEKDVYKYTQL